MKKFLAPLLVALAIVFGLPAVANAAVTYTLNPATVSGSDFTWSLDINPGGQTLYVAGRSFLTVGGGGYIETTRQVVSGTTTQRVTFTRDGEPNTSYDYRAAWYTSATTTTLLGRTAEKFTVVTSTDPVAPVASLSVSPTSGKEPLTVTADASGSTDVDNDIVSYRFSWGDNTADTVQSGATATHVYNNGGGTKTVTVTVTDSAGLTSTASATVNVTERIRTLFGSNANAAYKSTYDPIRVQRVFFGGAPGAWGSGYLANPIATHVSFKYSPQSVLAGTYDTALINWFSSAPTDRKIWWTFYHEPEDQVYKYFDFTALQYRQAWIRISNIQKQYAPSNVKSAVTLMAFTLSSTGRNYKDFFADNDTNYLNGSPYVDVMAWDLYYGTTIDDGTTEPANNFLEQFGPGSKRDIVAASNAVGTAVAVAEWGYDHVASRPSHLQMGADYLRGKAEYVTYFDFNGTTGDHRLFDSASQTTWRNVIAQTP